MDCAATILARLTPDDGLRTIRPGPKRLLRPEGRGDASRVVDRMNARRELRGRPGGSSREGPGHLKAPGVAWGHLLSGLEDRVDNARVWGRRERLQRSSGPLDPSPAPAHP